MFTWKLQTTLDTRNITRYALQKESGVPMNTVRAMYDGQTTRVDFSVLDRVLEALCTMTGEELQLSDVLEWRR
ncbi:helix-turn-helix transcriptional regulator [Deinococcus sp. QL22]|uniref:helix-turn-helix domain-containing protein n=1 Tax=Deinococcus sp. QL22 TaxID=2939437 RepID=UPI002017B8BE|nr:helix-turn-helix transcriptional regulator [Deinococcus sp. QL22]UQN10146.1 helix-turn-helix transcriptional regulator [Deinococcus sp. QL22]